MYMDKSKHTCEYPSNQMMNSLQKSAHDFETEEKTLLKSDYTKHFQQNRDQVLFLGYYTL